MARTLIRPFSSADATISGGITGSGVSFDATYARAGSGYCVRVQAVSGTTGYLGTYLSSSTPRWFRVGVRVLAAPSSTARGIIGVPIAGTGNVGIRLRPDKKLEVWFGGGVAITSTTALSDTSKYYVVQLQIPQSSGGGDLALRIDSTSEGTYTTAGSVFPMETVGALDTVADTYDVCFADFSIDDTAWCGVGGAVFLLPASDNNVGGWRTGASGTAALYDAVNNTPPVGTYATLATTGSQIHSLTNSATDDCDLNLQDYSAAGITATVNAVQLVIAHGEEIITGTKAGAIEVVSNPAQSASNAFNYGGDVSACAVYPTYWQVTRGDVLSDPSVTLGTSPVVRVGKRTATSRGVAVCFLGLAVDFNEPSGPAPVSGSGSMAVTAAMSGTGTNTQVVSGSGSLASPSPTMAGSGKQQHTGTGALASPTPALSGTGTAVVTRTGSGALAAPTPEMAGAGKQEHAGTGSLAVSATMAGAGKQQHTGTGSLEVETEMEGGTGTVSGAVFTGSGSLASPPPALSGAGKQEHVGVGALAAPQGTMAGQGIETFTGSGSLASAPPTLAGSALLTYSGSGSLAVAVGLAGTGTQTLSGSGSLAVSAALDGSGVVTQNITGTGTLDLLTALSGDGTVTAAGVSGSGSLASPTPEMAGTGTNTQNVVGSGELQVTASMAGTGQQQHTGTGTLAVATAFSGSGTNTQNVVGTGSLAIDVALSGAGAQQHTGSGSLAVTLTLDATGTNTQNVAGTGALEVPPPTMDGAGTMTFIGVTMGGTLLDVGVNEDDIRTGGLTITLTLVGGESWIP